MKYVVGAAVCVLLAGCGGATAYRLPDDGIGGAAVEFVTDEALRMLLAGQGALPTPRTELTYSDTRDFDLALFSSLRNYQQSSTANVRVSIQPEVTDVPGRMATWLGRLEQTGEIKVCEVNNQESLIAEIFTLFRGAWELFGPAVRQYVIYREASNYNAIVETDGISRKVRGVRFVPKSASFQAAQARYTRCR